jgi:hypothetical protein
MCVGVGDKTPPIFNLKIMAVATAYSTNLLTAELIT